MKKIYIVIAALMLSAGSFAQTADSLLKRQMELERDFNPTLLDADKINSLPALREPVVQKANTNYSSWAGRTTPPLEIALPRPGNIMTDIPFSTKKGYLSFSVGNYANMDGAFGYRLVENEKNNLTFSFLHNSTNGDIKYIQSVDAKTNKAYFMDNEGRLGYRHRAEALTFNIDLSYLHSLFNYYGNRFDHPALYEDENQRLGVLDTKISIASHESELLNYRGYINFRNFSTEFGELLNSEGIKGNEVNAMVGFDKPFGDAESKLGIDGKIFTTFYNGDLDNYYLMSASPYITFGTPNSYARLGADVLFQTAAGTRARVAPNVKLQWAVTEHSSLYANVHGGFSNNTFLEMMQESRYIRPYGTVKPSYSIIDLDAGAKIGEVSGFRFDIFGGFKKTEDEHFLILDGYDVVEGGESDAHKEVLNPVYGDLSHAHIGGMIQTNIWAPLDVSVRLKKNFYSLDRVTLDEAEINDPKAYNKPGFEVDIRAAFTLTDFLKLTANYYFAGDRWSYYDGANAQMDNINDLNAGALYQINDAFSIHLRANNLLSQKYDIWYGHPAQGINASGGFTFRF
ncbi:TonB dependent receptor [Proteiniphilum saccharofermentans]|uniref:TonB dependent receptor n=1 Tax=Proteiniphilum saccharofermentans TaxID=1642647 RepID=A0A1R3T4I5_9BACT|nr:TonB-dependent receptor [Proteiniphilum saccharofermentans]SCD19457.1 TonB dependent receptor [Proteiniphilum saccharofermentans]